MQRRRSFTLVELLVVIAVITILIAIVLPAFRKIRHRVLVLACPIAYVGEDGGVYLTSPNGNHELKISERGVVAYSSHGLEAPLAWSPCGRRLAYQGHNRIINRSFLYVTEPSRGTTLRIEHACFGGWVDYDSIMERGAYLHNIRNVETGIVEQTVYLDPERTAHYDTLTPTPIGSKGPYVASTHAGPHGARISFVRRDLRSERPFGPGQMLREGGITIVIP